MRIDSIFPLSSGNTSLNNTNIQDSPTFHKGNHTDETKKAHNDSLAKKNQFNSNSIDCYDLDVVIQELPSSPLAVTGTISLCGDTCSQTRCSMYTCNGGRDC